MGKGHLITENVVLTLYFVPWSPRLSSVHIPWWFFLCKHHFPTKSNAPILRVADDLLKCGCNGIAAVISSRGIILGQSEYSSGGGRQGRHLGQRGVDYLFRIRLNPMQGHGPGWELGSPATQSPLPHLIAAFLRKEWWECRSSATELKPAVNPGSQWW